MEKKKRKLFWHNFKFKYKLTILNENTLEEVVGIHVSKLNGLSILLVTCLFIFFVAAIIIIFTPLRNYLPGYMNSEIRSQVVANALRADSLQEALFRQNRYIMNIQDILSGQVKVDTVESIDSLTILRSEELMERTKEEEEFRKRYEEEERFNLTSVNSSRIAADVIFYRPVQGIISAKFNPSSEHFGVDLTAGPDENIFAALDGTVILSAYTAEYGYIMQIQHLQNMITVYKHCGSLMKKDGEKVKGGEVIGLARKRKSEEEQVYVHFELWYKGNPINPETYVAF